MATLRQPGNYSDCEEHQQDRKDSSEVGFYVAVAAVGILLVVIICFVCYIARLKDTKRLRRDDEEHQQDHHLKSKNERLGKDSLKRENERLVKDILKSENERLGKDDEELQQDHILKRGYETLGKENEGLLEQNETLKQEKEKVEAEKEVLLEQNDSLKREKENAEDDIEELRRKTNTCGYVLDREWKPITEARVNVTLDPDTASPSLTVSEDGSRVRFTGDRLAEWPSVLGREGFTSGKHYWEVEVGEKGYWVLGVSTHTHEKSIPEKPGEGYWLVRLVKGKTCKAVSQSVDQTLNLEKMCKMWGVYLDHGGGRLSFYNAETRFHIHTLEGSFPGQVYPIFSPGSHDKGPLIINTKVKNV